MSEIPPLKCNFSYTCVQNLTFPTDQQSVCVFLLVAFFSARPKKMYYVSNFSLLICNTDASDVCAIKITYLLTYLPHLHYMATL